MGLIQLQTNYAAYNVWANTLLTKWLSSCDSSLLEQTMSSSFPSIGATLGHILKAQQFWMCFIAGDDITQFNWKAALGTPQEIMHKLVDSSKEFHALIDGLSEEALCTTKPLEMKWAKNNQPLYEYIQHVINHATYHRGQIVTMARHFGVTEGIPNMDYQFFTMSR